MLEREGRCSYCGHVRTLTDDGMMRLHHYLGSAKCKGSFKPPVPNTITEVPDSPLNV